MRRLALAASLSRSRSPAPDGAGRHVRRRSRQSPPVAGDAARCRAPTIPNATALVLLAARACDAAPPSEQLSYAELRGIWQRAGAAYGIPWQVLAAINKVESNFGRNMGPSSAGAIGWMQFMPDDLAALGHGRERRRHRRPVEPRRRDLLRGALPRRRGRRTDISARVFAYNHADWYVDEVLELARAVRRRRGTEVAVSLDRLAAGSSTAPQRAVAAPERGSRRQRRPHVERALARRHGRSPHERPRHSSSPTGSRCREGRVPGRRCAPRREPPRDATRLRTQLQSAEATLGQARRRSRCDGLVRSGRRPASCGGPSYQGGYVFPVGGGPGVVSVSHHHHDYPAADIAAPRARRSTRSPTASSLAPGSSRRPLRHRLHDPRRFDGRAGRTATSRTATRPSLAGARVAARASRSGLVGSTGHATGPAPPSPAAAGDVVSAGRAVVPGVRGQRVHLAGRADESEVTAGAGLRDVGRRSSLLRPRPSSGSRSIGGLSPRRFVPKSEYECGSHRLTAARRRRSSCVDRGAPHDRRDRGRRGDPSHARREPRRPAPSRRSSSRSSCRTCASRPTSSRRASLEQDGFAWRVTAPCPGFAANVVVSQSPAPGTRVFDDGAPTSSLRLSRNATTRRRACPRTSRPYAGKPSPGRSACGAAEAKDRPGEGRHSGGEARESAAAEGEAVTAEAAKPTPPPARARPPSSSPARRRSRSTRSSSAPARSSSQPGSRSIRSRTAANVDHWLYQHAWIVTGAKLRLVATAPQALRDADRRRPAVSQKLWGVGSQSEQVARAAARGGPSEVAIEARLVRRLARERAAATRLMELLIVDGHPRQSS